MRGLFTSIIGSLIVAFFIFIGGALADKYTPQEVSLEFELKEYNSGDIRAYILSFNNRTDFEIEEIDISIPPEGIIVSNFSSENEGNFDNTLTDGVWNGSLLKGEVISAIIVYESEDNIINSSNFSEKVSAKFSDRDAQTGKLFLNEAGVVPMGNWPRAEKLIYFGIYALPSVILMLIFGIFMIFTKRKSQ